MFEWWCLWKHRVEYISFNFRAVFHVGPPPPLPLNTRTFLFIFFFIKPSSGSKIHLTRDLPSVMRTSVRWKPAAPRPLWPAAQAESTSASSLALFSLIMNRSLLRYVRVSCIIIRLLLWTRTGLGPLLWSLQTGRGGGKLKGTPQDLKLEFFFLLIPGVISKSLNLNY